MTDKQRLRKVYKHLINKGVADTQKDIAEKMKVNYTYLSGMGKSYVLNDSFIDKLVKLDSDLNKVWVQSGEGEMLLSENSPKNSEKNKVNTRISFVEKQITLSEKEFLELKKQVADLIITNKNLSTTNKNLSEMINKKSTAGSA